MSTQTLFEVKPLNTPEVKQDSLGGLGLFEICFGMSLKGKRAD